LVATSSHSDRAAERDRERMTLLADLEAFVHDHRPHGALTGDATEPAWTVGPTMHRR